MSSLKLEFRPWDAFVQNMKPPANVNSAIERVKINLNHYRANYGAVAAVIALIGMFYSHQFLLASAISGAVGAALFFLVKPGTQVGGTTIVAWHKAAVVGVVALLAIHFTESFSCVVWVLVISLLISVVHATFKEARLQTSTPKPE
jgi:PRA1 family protein